MLRRLSMPRCSCQRRRERLSIITGGSPVHKTPGGASLTARVFRQRIKAVTIIATTLSLCPRIARAERTGRNRVDSSPLRHARGYVRYAAFIVKRLISLRRSGGRCADSEPVLHPVSRGVTLMVIKSNFTQAKGNGRSLVLSLV